MFAKGVLRLLLGFVFGYFGYFAINQLVPIELGNNKSTVAIIAALSLASAGFYVEPVVGKWIGDFIKLFSRRVAQEMMSQMRLPRIPSIRSEKVEKEKWVNPILVDTSALIDGRIADAIESGFVFGTIIVPDFILVELQHIADSADSLKRGRGRRGLDVLESIKKSSLVKTTVYDTGQISLKNIDDRLLRLGKSLKAKILTNDFNLNKIATVSGVKILNINELANAMKTTLLPGEEIEVKVIQEGKEKSQGVGYLPDGTMIVVENGASFVGKRINAKVSRVIQTVAGRMIFVQALN
jgi:uncharacterized protein YacL